MTTLTSLVDRLRIELGDQGRSFVTQFMADGTTNRFRLHYSPLDGPNLVVFKNGVEISNDCSVEEATGVLVTDELPDDGDEFTVSGNYFRYFTTAELEQVVTTAVLQHGGRKTDTVGRPITIETLPVIEEYPVVLYASTLALYILATDASFDIDIMAPDGVTIPRSQRYRQLMEIIDTRKEQYKEMCMLLGIGMYTIEIATLRRISQRTNRYVPVYKPQEVDDRSVPQRVDLPLPTYGDAQMPWPTDAGSLLAYEGIAYTHDIDFAGDFTGKSFIARLLSQRGSVVVVRTFDLTVTDNEDGTFVATVELSAENTRRIAKRTWWSLASVDDETGEIIEIKGGDFFIERVSEAIV